MKFETVVAILGLLVAISDVIAGATFAYVVSMEHRMTRLETKDELRGGRQARAVLAPAPMPQLERRAPAARVLARDER